MTLVESARQDARWFSDMETWTMTMFRIDDGVVQINLVGPWRDGIASHKQLMFRHMGKVARPTSDIRTMRGLDLLGCPEGCVLIWNENGV